MNYFSAAKKPQYLQVRVVMLSIVIKWKTSTIYKNIYEQNDTKMLMIFLLYPKEEISPLIKLQIRLEAGTCI